MSSKLQVFLMFPVLFLGTIPSLCDSLTKLAHAIILLTGRVISERSRRDKGYACMFVSLFVFVCCKMLEIKQSNTSNRYQTCSNHVLDGDIERSELLISEGLSEFGKEVPPSTMKSHAHHIVHYPRCVDFLGPLNGQWLFGDERRNKVYTLFLSHIERKFTYNFNSVQTVKDMVKQRQNCETSIARLYSEYFRGAARVHSPPPVSLDTCCVRTRYCKGYFDTNPRVSCLLRIMTSQEYNGAEVDVELWTVHKRAQIGGFGFTSGQPMTGVRRTGEKTNRCGSVITLVRGGRSLYAWVIRFLSFDRIHVDHVRWLPVPEYPTGSPLVVRLNGGHPPPDQPCIVSLVDIDPSRVSILHENTNM